MFSFLRRKNQQQASAPAANGAGGGAGRGNQAAAEQLGGGGLLRKGARGEAVRALQQQLVAQGQQIDVDGVFGDGTERALRAVQGKLGLDADGVAGPKTMAALSGPAPKAQGPAVAAPARGGGKGEDAAPTPKQGADEGPREVLGNRMNPGAFARSGLRPAVFGKALDAFRVAWARGDTKRTEFTVIDYELPSDQKRLWVIDLATGKLLHHERVAHGRGSDPNNDGRVDQMGNTPEAGTSNVGMLKTAETYQGKHGLSLRLDGLERGFNHNARRRAVVVHAADYVDEDVVAGQGRAGRSLGCPALDPDVNGEIIRTIRGGSLIFAYWPDPKWLRESRYLQGGRGGNS